MKLFKEMLDRVYKRGRVYCVSIWSGRFASTLVQGGEHLARCKRYVVYNPVRADIVAQAREYCWSWREEDEASDAGGDWCLRRLRGRYVVEARMERQRLQHECEKYGILHQ